MKNNPNTSFPKSSEAQSVGHPAQDRYRKRIFGLLLSIPDGEKALVTSVFGKKREVSGPATVSGFSTLRPFERIELDPHGKAILHIPSDDTYTRREVDGPSILYRHPDGMVEYYGKVLVSEGEKGWLIKPDGTHEDIEGPKVIYVHPEGQYRPFQKIQLTERQACVVVGQDGKERIVRGVDTSIIYINPLIEQCKQFQWTGSGTSPDSEKVPGALRFQILRLDDTQTYFSFSVRTKDNAVLIVRLMIFYGISDLETLILSGHDPLCGFYNKIQAGVTEKVSSLTFDEFKLNPADHIEGVPELSEDSFADIGIGIKKVALREWGPEDPKVQQTLERAAVVQTEKELDRAGHERKMAQADYAQKELQEAQKLKSLQLDVAQEEGVREGKKLTAMLDEIKKSASPEDAIALMKLHLASGAKELNIGSDLLR